ncbi:MAG: hypothetical protein A2Y24_06820 [Clostridiales bacterium GWE2_32_10]|nr:MAG: hypothetical protein A2Y24_06820 [Clostridiales bacterium GWE2_32_10]HBY19965.1 hypothetical protein [Clostridiales bacterium]
MSKNLELLINAETREKELKLDHAGRLISCMQNQIEQSEISDSNMVYSIYYMEGIVKDLVKIAKEIEMKQDLINKLEQLKEAK